MRIMSVKEQTRSCGQRWPSRPRFRQLAPETLVHDLRSPAALEGDSSYELGQAKGIGSFFEHFHYARLPAPQVHQGRFVVATHEA